MGTEVKLFNKFSFEEVNVSDIALTDYIAAKAGNAHFVPHSAGRWQKKRFKKAQCPVVERMTNALMKHGRNNGKKLLAVRIMRHVCDIIALLTGENPVQVIVDASCTLALVRILAASALLVLCVARPLMSLHC